MDENKTESIDRQYRSILSVLIRRYIADCAQLLYLVLALRASSFGVYVLATGLYPRGGGDAGQYWRVQG
jgi:hypothetical protein